MPSTIISKFRCFTCEWLQCSVAINKFQMQKSILKRLVFGVVKRFLFYCQIKTWDRSSGLRPSCSNQTKIKIANFHLTKSMHNQSIESTKRKKVKNTQIRPAHNTLFILQFIKAIEILPKIDRKYFISIVVSLKIFFPSLTSCSTKQFQFKLKTSNLNECKE